MILCKEPMRLRNDPNRAAKKNATNNRKTSRISAVNPRDMTATSTLIKNIVTKSAMTVASNIVCPNRVWLSPASLRTGSTTPNAVVERINPIIHGSVVAPIHFKPQANPPANNKVAPKLRTARESGLQRGSRS